VSEITKEHIVLFRQYFMSDDESNKKKILESLSTNIIQLIFTVQEGFDKFLDARSIALSLQSPEFEKEIEQIQSEYYSNIRNFNDPHFEAEVTTAIKHIERVNLKKKLIAFDEMVSGIPSEAEIKSAITLLERNSLKEKLKRQDHKGKVVSIYENIVGKTVAASRIPFTLKLSSIIKYAVAACFVLAIGIGVYYYSAKRSNPKDNVAVKTEQKQPSQKPNIASVIEKEPLAEIITTSSSSNVLEYGLGFGEKIQKITIVEHYQQERIASIHKAIEKYQKLLDKEQESMKTGSGNIMTELQSRISTLNIELQNLNAKEKRYIFDGKVLTLYISSPSKNVQILFYNNNYYLKTNNLYFKLLISSNPQVSIAETDSNVLKALDKIIFNAN